MGCLVSQGRDYRARVQEAMSDIKGRNFTWLAVDEAGSMLPQAIATARCYLCGASMDVPRRDDGTPCCSRCLVEHLGWVKETTVSMEYPAKKILDDRFPGTAGYMPSWWGRYQPE
jgi:hypothetical protein